MAERRIIVYGNAGSGKTTMARSLGLPYLCLDHIAWGPSAIRKPLPESVAALEAFTASHVEWVIEGCYGDLVEVALPRCTELRFLNPGVEACVANCRSRPWEPSYCESPEEQQRLLGPLIEFVREYESRTDEYGLARHRDIFELFTGPQREYSTNPAAPRAVPDCGRQ
jgi:hypothetical protein